VQQQNQNLALRAEITQLEVAASELQEEVAGLQLRLRSFGSNVQGQDKQWAESVKYSLQQKQAQLEQTMAELEALKNKVGASNAR